MADSNDQVQEDLEQLKEDFQRLRQDVADLLGHQAQRTSDEAVDWDTLDRADEVKRPNVDLRTEVKPRTRLARLLREAPDLSEDAEALVATNAALAQSLADHRAAAAAIASGRGAARRPQGEGPPPAPRATWGTARSAATDISHLDDAIRNAETTTRQALPKGRNFH